MNKGALMRNSIVSISVTLSFTIFISAFSQLVSAHARWAIAPTDTTSNIVAPRSNSTGLKEPGPCGGIARTNNPAVLKSGDVVTVKFRETIYHNGHFRIAFSPAADANFDENVLVDSIPAVRNVKDGIYTQTITLPDIACDDCTLQLIQFMSDSQTNYYSCADIQLTATGTPTPPEEDLIAPSNANNLATTGGDSQVSIAWTNPLDDFFKVIILQDTQPITANPLNKINYELNDVIGTAKVIYSNNGESHTATGLENGVTYYYKIFTYDTSLNYATGIESFVSLAANVNNIAPSATLIAEQSQTVTTIVTQDAGNVIVQLTVNDPNPSDMHTYNWSQTDSRLIDLDTSDTNFTFNPSGLTAGMYTVGVEVSDDGVPSQSTTTTLSLQVIAPRSTTAEAPATKNTEAPTETSSSSLDFYLILTGLLFSLVRLTRKSC